MTEFFETLAKLFGYLSPLLVILFAQIAKKVLGFMQKFVYWEKVKPILVIVVGALVVGVMKAWGGNEVGSAIAELKKLFGDSGFITILAMTIYRLWKVIVKGK